jgi:prepilin-type N-terminal cleavage/methylation domain-containing protein
MRHTQRAFTIVELLVVIGIIAVLIGILVPVINQVRRAGYVADCKNQITVIANAVERYHTDYQAYPGYFSNSQISAGIAPSGAGGNLTMSENAVLSLCGGLRGTAGTPEYIAADLGKGPLSFGTNQKRRQAYLEVTPKAMSVAGSELDPAITNWGSAVPEFIDRFPQAMPIIYLRARVGAPGVAPTAAGNDNLQYNPAHMLPYYNSPYNSPPTAGNGISTSDFAANGGDRVVLRQRQLERHRRRRQEQRYLHADQSW